MLNMRILQSGFRTAWAHKLRAVLMVVSVMIGIAALTVIISLGKGTEEKITTQVQKFLSSNTIIVLSHVGRLQPNRPVAVSEKLKIADVEEIARQVENVLEWDAVQQTPDKEARANGNDALVDVVGQTPLAEVVWNFTMTEGRFFSNAENQSLARVAVIAPHVRERLFGASDPVGQQIKIDNVPFQVVGTIGPRGLDPHGMDKDNEIIIPLNTMLRRVVNLDYVVLAKFVISDERRLNASAEQITHILRERHSIQANEDDDFMVITPVRVKEIIDEASRMFNWHLPLLAVVSLLVGGVVVVNLMLISVGERVKEIGLRKAVGAKSKDISTQFLIEASSVTLVSGIAGIVVGILLLTQITKLLNVPFTISWGALLICFIVSALVGIIAGFFPAKKAANLSAVESLR